LTPGGLVALDAEERLRELGVNVVGPVSNVSDALRIADTDDEPLDGALLDIAPNRQTVCPVAAFLAMKQIPFAFVTGYEGRQAPAFYRSVPTSSSPATGLEGLRSLEGLNHGLLAAYARMNRSTFIE